MDSSVLFCMPCLCSQKRSLRVRPVCAMYYEGRVVLVIRETREMLMDSSGLSGIMKGVGGYVVGYEFTRFASTIITGSYFWWRRR